VGKLFTEDQLKIKPQQCIGASGIMAVFIHSLVLLWKLSSSLYSKAEIGNIHAVCMAKHRYLHRYEWKTNCVTVTLTVDVHRVVCLTSVIIARRPRDVRPRGGPSGSCDVIVTWLLLQTQRSTLVLGREAIAVAMTTAVEEASTLAPNRFEVPHGVVVGAWAGVFLQLAHSAVCST